MKKILVVDDEEDVRMVIKTRVSLAGYNVEDADGGQKAIDMYREAVGQAPYDLILLDIMMPEVDGKDVLDTIRQEESERGIKLGNGTPVIMLTAAKEGFMDAFDRGCDDYILKPYEHEDLLTKIKDKLG